jgi:hypothetical protein
MYLAVGAAENDAAFSCTDIHHFRHFDQGLRQKKNVTMTTT